MEKWIQFRNGQYPRMGEIIAVKSKAGVYPRLLVAEGNLDFWEYIAEDAPRYARGDFSGTKLSFHGLTHWQLVDSPY